MISHANDVALIGTGVASLVAACRLMAEGKRVILLNPDWDFFREDSELGVDPDLTKNWELNHPENIIEILRPEFPGAIELSPDQRPGFHDPLAPHVRIRSRLNLCEDVEPLFLQAGDLGFHPTIVEGLSAAKRFPGFSGKNVDSVRGVLIPNVGDVDVIRYRNSLLEYVRERLGPDQVINAVHGLELIPEGLRYQSGNQVKTVRLLDGALIFWTLSLSSWVKKRVKVFSPSHYRVWEDWLLLSREELDPNWVASRGDWTVWVDGEGALKPGFNLRVLRAGPRFPLDETSFFQAGRSVASKESLDALSSLCHGFLGWNRFSVRNLRARYLLEWQSTHPISVPHGVLKTQIVQGADGPLVQIVQAARAATEAYL